jgi:hypothetical protein
LSDRFHWGPARSGCEPLCLARNISKAQLMTPFIIDPFGQIAEANAAAERLFRYAEKRIHEKKGIIGSSTTSRQPRNYN